ncbi:MAG: hypothetical protein VXY65_09345 [Actinomycetota bacterium]|nr:hypothetical protein [Actinomycetota bacterium]
MGDFVAIVCASVDVAATCSESVLEELADVVWLHRAGAGFIHFSANPLEFDGVHGIGKQNVGFDDLLNAFLINRTID